MSTPRKPAPPSSPGQAAASAPVFDQSHQTAAQQLNAARDIVIHNTPPPPVPPFPTTSAAAIQQIEREFGQDLRAVVRHYVMPDFQDFNPPDEANSPSLIVSRQPAFQVIDEFIARPNLHEIGQRCLFVLGDAGMGKTFLLLMLAARHFAAPKSPERECVLLKLGPDTLERISAVPNPARTVLLLDSLDEDPAAHGHAGGAEGRLLELLPRLVHFHRIVLTCRSQFFPEYSRHLTTLPGHFVVGPYECPLKYLALFNDAQVEQYLEKRYRSGRLLRRIRSLLLGLEDSKMAEAREAAKSMESLRLRPLLLSRIDDFVSQEGRPGVDFHNSYAVYHRLVDQWLKRDAPKLHGMDTDAGWQVAVLLALHLTRRGVRKIGSKELAGIPGLEDIPRFKLEARSLLNRNKDREFQFAHATIQEFLLAHAILDDDKTGFEVAGLSLSREPFRFLMDGNRFLGRETVDLRGARADYPEAAVELVQQICGLELVPLPPGEFLMGSPPDEEGRDRNETQHRVRLTQPFWIGRYPVTQAEYEAVLGENPSHFKDPRRPVENLDWHQAMAFCAKLTEQARAAGCLPEGFVFRLPTEAEWEYACRAGTTSAFNDGSDCTKPYGKDPALQRLGWFCENSGRKTHPVREKAPNTWGLHDTHGNVFEWCLDGQREYTADSQTDPLGPMDSRAGRVVRGGAWLNQACDCRAAFRFRYEPSARFTLLGLRLAAGQEPGAASFDALRAMKDRKPLGAERLQSSAGGAGAPGPAAPAGGERSEPRDIRPS